jgi:hypothetical protein
MGYGFGDFFDDVGGALDTAWDATSDSVTDSLGFTYDLARGDPKSWGLALDSFLDVSIYAGSQIGEYGGRYIGSPVATGAVKAWEGFEYASREYVREPLATALIAGSLADSAIFQGEDTNIFTSLTNLFDADVWTEAHDMAQTTSPGQALALALTTNDILDEDEVADAVNSPLFSTIAITADFAQMFFLDVDIIGGKVLAPIRATRSLTLANRAEKATRMGRVGERAGLLTRLTRSEGLVRGALRSEDYGDAGADVLKLWQNRRFAGLADNQIEAEIASALWDITKDDLTIWQRVASNVPIAGRRGEAARAFARNADELANARVIDEVTGEVVRDVGAIRDRVGAAADSYRHVRIDQLFDVAQRGRSIRSLPFGANSKWRRWNSQLEDIVTSIDDVNIRTSRIQETLLAKHGRGAEIASVLAHTDSVAQREEVMRFFMGDTRAAARLMGDSDLGYALGRRMEDVLRERSALRYEVADLWTKADDITEAQLSYYGISDSTIFSDISNGIDRLKGIDREIGAVMRNVVGNSADATVADRLYATARTIHEMPQLGRTRAATSALRHSGFYQTAFFKPVRVFVENVPHHIINLADSRVAALTRRAGKAAGMSEDEVAAWAGRMSNTPLDARPEVWDEMQRFAERRLMGEYGLDASEMQIVMDYAAKQRRSVSHTFRGNEQRLYDAAKVSDEFGGGRDIINVSRVDDQARRGMARLADPANPNTPAPGFDRPVTHGLNNVKFIDDDLGTFNELHYPFKTTELRHQVVTPDWKGLRNELERAARIKYGDRWREAIRSKAPFIGGSPDQRLTKIGRRLSRVGESTNRRLGKAGIETLSASRLEDIEDLSGIRPFRIVGKGLDGVLRYWRTATLLRPAWAGRVIPDEQLRGLAQFGTLVWVAQHGDRFRDLTTSLKKIPSVNRALSLDQSMFSSAAKGALWGGALGVGTSAVAQGEILPDNLGESFLFGAAGGAAGGAILNRMANLKRHGYGDVIVGGHRLRRNPMDGPLGNVWAGEVSAKSTFGDFLNAHESSLFDDLVQDRSSWTTYEWNRLDSKAAAAYRKSWREQAQNHITVDAMSRQVLEGKSKDEILAWLIGTTDGRAHAARLPARAKYPEEWVDGMFDQVTSYFGGNAEAMTAALDLANSGNRSAKSWNKILEMIPDEMRSPVHGASLQQVIGSAGFQQSMQRLIDDGFSLWSTTPTDTLSRMPAFRLFYESELHRMLDDLPASKLRPDDIWRAEDNARRFALRETRDLMYDLAEQSEFSEMVKMFMPFFSAYQEVLTRWAGLAVHNPVFVARAAKLWTGAENLGVSTTNEEGDPEFTFRLPEAAKDFIGHIPMMGSAIDNQGYLKLDKRSFNLVMQGTPGFGPFVTIPTSEIVKRNPDLEDSVRFILPFGPSPSWTDQIIPAWMKRVKSSFTEDAAYQAAFVGILQTRLTDIELGNSEYTWREISDDPEKARAFFDEIADETHNLFALRTYASLISPVQPQFVSPYQPYVEVFRAIQAGDLARAEEVMADVVGAGGPAYSRADIERITANYTDEAGNVDAVLAFFEMFGDEFYAIARSTSRVNDGIPSTIEAEEVRDKYRTLVEKYPEWGGVIVGAEGSLNAQFSYAVYLQQLTEEVSPGSGVPRRERFAADQPLTWAQNARAVPGWQEYSQKMDQLDQALYDLGLANYQVADAQPLAEIRRQFINDLASRNPEWWAEYSDRRGQAETDDFWTGAYEIASDERLLGRREIEGLASYLELRDTMISALGTINEAGGAATLTATSNQPLREVWDALVLELLDQYPEFGEIYYRRLEGSLPTIGLGRSDLVGN